MKYLDQYTPLTLLLRAAVVYAIKCLNFILTSVHIKDQINWTRVKQPTLSQLNKMKLHHRNETPFDQNLAYILFSLKHLKHLSGRKLIPMKKAHVVFIKQEPSSLGDINQLLENYRYDKPNMERCCSFSPSLLHLEGHGCRPTLSSALGLGDLFTLSDSNRLFAVKPRLQEGCFHTEDGC